MSTLAERSALDSAIQFQASPTQFTSEPVLAPEFQRLTQNGQPFTKVDSQEAFAAAQTEYSAAQFLVELFGVPQSLPAMEVWLVLQSKLVDAISWKKKSAEHLVDQLQTWVSLLLTRQAEIEQQLAAEEEAWQTLQIATGEVKAETINPILATTKETVLFKMKAGLSRRENAVLRLQIAHREIRRTIQGLTNGIMTVTSEVLFSQNWQLPVLPEPKT